MSVSTLDNQNVQLTGSSCQPGPDSSVFQPKDLLSGIIDDYRFGFFKHRGCLSDVAQCRVADIDNDIVAMKIFKKTARDSQQLKRELDVLKKIRGLDPVHIVRFFENFHHKGHTCLVFENLDKNLHQLLKERHGKPLPLHVIRPVAQQLLSALHTLKTAGIIHTSIKPHHVMLVKQEVQQPIRVKLTGFGSAIPAAEVQSRSIMQPAGYRSPEVLLGLPISEAADMWSVGAVLSTMFLGSPLFPQRCQYHLMKTLVEVLGQPEDELLREGINTQLYFTSTENIWTLKTPEEYKAATGFPPQILRRFSTKFNSLSELVKLFPDEETDDDKLKFVSLLEKMLTFNPRKRISPSDALKHPFLTLSIKDKGDSSSHALVSAASVSVLPVAASSDEAASSPDHAGRNDTTPAVAEASESSAILDNHTASAEQQSPRGDPDEAAVTSASSIVIQTGLHEAISAEEGPVETHSAAEPTDEVMAEAQDTTNAPRRPLKRVRRFFGRVFRTLCCCCCCCCSAQGTE